MDRARAGRAASHSEGAAITTAGVIPTPATAYITRTQGFDAGLVISASHNPFEDNGIKVFSGRGEKFTETLERQVEAIIADRRWQVPPERTRAGRAHRRRPTPTSSTRCSRCPIRGRSGGSSIAIDCANGATTTVAPRLFTGLGFDVTVIGDEPDGRNINLDCGSTHPERLAALVVATAAIASASRSTATGTARFSSTTRAASWTATP